jgi:hypothetical protein
MKIEYLERRIPAFVLAFLLSGGVSTTLADADTAQKSRNLAAVHAVASPPRTAAGRAPARDVAYRQRLVEEAWMSEQLRAAGLRG